MLHIEVIQLHARLVRKHDSYVTQNSYHNIQVSARLDMQKHNSYVTQRSQPHTENHARLDGRKHHTHNSYVTHTRVNWTLKTVIDLIQEIKSSTIKCLHQVCARLDVKKT